MTKISNFGKQNSTLGSVVPLAMFLNNFILTLQSQREHRLRDRQEICDPAFGPWNDFYVHMRIYIIIYVIETLFDGLMAGFMSRS